MISIDIANSVHLKFADEIVVLMEEAAKKRGTGIAKRSVEYIKNKIRARKAVIATNESAEFVGFCYIESWEHEKYVANSGLIIKEKYRGLGLARKLKTKAFKLSRQKYPHAKIFGITTSIAVMKINTSLGYKAVSLEELTKDSSFWKGCKSCVNFQILEHTGRTHCLCTGMLFDPDTDENKIKESQKIHVNDEKN